MSKCRWDATIGILAGLLLILPLSACGGGKGAVSTEEIRKRGRLEAGVKYDAKPFGFMDADGRLKGYEIDLLREITRRLLRDPHRVNFQQVWSSTRVLALQSGAVDVVAATMTITPERARQVDFSQPYLIARQAVVVPYGSPVRQLNDLEHRTILYVLGSTSEAHIRQRLPKASYHGYKSATEAFSALKAGRGDAMTTDDTLIAGFLSDQCGFRMLPERLSDEPYGLAFRRGGSAGHGPTLRAQVNQYLNDMKKDGTLAKLNSRWLDTAHHARPCRP